MSNSLKLFESVFSGLLSSLSAATNQIFNDFDETCSSNLFSESQLDNKLESILLVFPRNHQLYPKLITTLTAFADSNPLSILKYLCFKFKNELNRKENNPQSIISIISLKFDNTDFYHFQFLKHLNLIILTDIIYNIMKTYKIRQNVQKLVSCGYSLCKDNHRLKALQMQLIDSWSNIFLIYSFDCLSDITMSFDKYFDNLTSENILRLISKIQGNKQFANAILFVTNQMKKRKALTSELLSNLSVLITRIYCDKDCLNEFFKIATDNKGNKILSEGRFDLQSALLTRLPSLSKKISSFCSRLYKNAHKDSHVQRSIRAFLRLIRGDISNVFTDELSPLDFIDLKGNLDTQESYISIFMKVFFPKSNFALSRECFRDVLIHLASLNISEFTECILSNFTKLEPNDTRFLVLLTAIPFINTPKFKQVSYCKASTDQIQIINYKIRQVLLDHLDIIDQEIENGQMILIKDFFQLEALIDEADNTVNEFLIKNNITNFEGHSKNPTSKIFLGDVYSFILQFLKCIPIVFSDDDFRNSTIIQLIIKLTCNTDQLISTAAIDIFNKVLTKRSIVQDFIDKDIELIGNTYILELKAQCAKLLFDTISKYCVDLKQDTLSKIEVISFSLLFADIPYCRVYGLKILNQLLINGKSKEYQRIYSYTIPIAESAKFSIQVHNISEKPSVVTLLLGSLMFETVCNSYFNDLWLIYFAELMNGLINSKDYESLDKIGKYISERFDSYEPNIKSGNISFYYAALIFIAYFDTFAIKCIQPINQEEEDKEKEEEDLYNDDHEENLQIIFLEEAYDTFLKLLSSSSEVCVNAILIAFRYINWAIIPSILPAALSVNEKLYQQVLRSLNIIIQNPNNYSNVLRMCFHNLTHFLVSLQDYFIHLDINGPKSIEWDKKHLELIHKYEDVCIDYCILIAATFNNKTELTEEEWPIASRQLQVQFLFHWIELPSSFEKFKEYILNALIPILNAGLVFTNGLSLSKNMLHVLLQYQLSGYSIFDRLLYFHVNTLLETFSQQVFIQPKRESSVFVEAIVNCLELVVDSASLQDHLGYVILVSMFCSTEKLEFAKSMLLRIAILFLNIGKDDESYILIQKAENLDFLPSVFQFAIEEVIDAGFKILKNSNKITITKTVVDMLVPWIEKLRILPTQKYILQGIPKKYRRFTVMSFFESMFELSKEFNEENHDIFSKLWFELLKSADNSTVVLLCLSEMKEDKLKEKIFVQLLDKDPKLITKYLSKRLTFAYWYFIKTQPVQSDATLKWIRNILARAFIYYPIEASTHFTTIFHYAILFIEESQDLYENIMTLFEIETNEYSNLWAPFSNDGMLLSTASIVVSQIVMILNEQRSIGIGKWTQEAIRWAIGCSDIKIAYRSLVILNIIQNPEIPNIQLFFDAVKYHLSQATEDNYGDLTKYVSEVFKLLYFYIDDPTITNQAFKFASSFLHCQAFEKSSLRFAMPIFLHCVNSSSLGTIAKSILVGAFISFAPILETNKKAQEMLLQVIKIVNKSELYLITAPFLLQNLPFVSVGKTYSEIISLSFTFENIQNILYFYSKMLKTSSRSLSDSILTVVDVLLKKYKAKLNMAFVAPIYDFALKRISSFESSVRLIYTISKIDPLIMSVQYDNSNQISFQSIIKQIDEIYKTNNKIVSVTNCKDINQIYGIIDQKNPPKIKPFATQYEMYLSLQRDSAIETLSNKSHNINRMSSSISTNSSFLSTNSVALASVKQDYGIETTLEPLKFKKVIFKTLDLPKDTISNWRLIVSMDEFSMLKD